MWKLTLSGSSLVLVFGLSASVFPMAVSAVCFDDLCPQANPAGFDQSAHTAGFIDKTNPFFQKLGQNDRTCNTCHLADQGWSIALPEIRTLFRDTNGSAPLFVPIDAANAPTADISTPAARASAYSQILSRGVIRIGRPMPDPATREFELASVDDPSGLLPSNVLSLFRRPLPIGDLRFLSTVNWDGRSNTAPDLESVRLGLMNQANGATRNHAQATAALSSGTQALIADWELGLHHAQVKHKDAGALDQEGATGAVESLLPPFTPSATANRVFTLYDSWEASTSNARRKIAAGQRVFNSKTFGTGGTLTCAICHNRPNIGASVTIRFFDIGISDPSRRKADQVLFTFRNTLTQETLSTLDPGRGLFTGRWADLNKFKVPSLRGLASRPPYFHDGSAASIADVVAHYERHFNINFRGGEKGQLIAFLESL